MSYPRGLSRITRARGLPRRALLAASAALVTVPLVLAGGPASAVPETPAEQVVPSGEAPADAWALREKLRAENGDVFGGLYADASGKVVLTATAGGEATVRAAQQRFDAARGVTGLAASPRVVTVKRGLNRLEGLKAAVTQARGLMGSGLVNLVDVDEATNRVHVGLAADTPANRARVTKAIGASADELSFGVAAAVPATADRFTDVAPFNAGDRIYNENATRYMCTSGFGVHQTGTGTDFLLTAAHCSNVAGAQDFFWNGGPSNTRRTAMGFSQNVSFGTNGWDTQLIRTESSTLTWTAQSNRNAITAPFTPVQNDVNKMINEGATSIPWGSGLMNVDRVDVCQNVRYETWGVVPICHFWSSTPTAAGCAVRGGDSGGPVVTYSSFGPLAVGLIVAGSCDRVWFHAIGDMLAKNPHNIAGGLHVNTVGDPGD